MLKQYPLFERFFVVVLQLIVLFFLFGCAQPGSLGGGPKDTEPAKVLSCSPPNGSARFKDNKFTIYFDEFIELDNLNQKMLISPPTDKVPDFHVKGKSLQVQFKEDLKPNTTYSVYFGDAIVDITEKNPLLNYVYIFSTGETVDSLSLRGEVLNAFDKKPIEGIFVMLYKDNNDTLKLDSLPLALKPYYLSKTDKTGKFMFNGLANEKYLLFAIKDMNANYFFDQPIEEIAYFDSLVKPEFANIKKLESQLPESDSAVKNTDSIVQSEVKIKNYTLLMFAEKDSTQKLLTIETLRKNTIRFSYNLPADSITYKAINYRSDTIQLVETFSQHRDTVTWYLRALPVDTLELVILNKNDTLEKVFLSLKPKKSTKKGAKKKDEAEEKEYIGWTTNTKSSVITLSQQPEISFFSPIESLRADSVLLVAGTDSIYNPEMRFTDTHDMILQIPLQLKEDTRYQITFPDSVFTDWNGLSNKEIKLSFRTKPLKDYGTFTLTLHPPKQQNYILLLLNEKEVRVREIQFSGDTTINMLYLDPGKYSVKLIFDNNGNGLWDSGKYIYKLQPEKIILFNKPVDIRANWDINEEWEF